MDLEILEVMQCCAKVFIPLELFHILACSNLNPEFVKGILSDKHKEIPNSKEKNNT